MIKRGLDSSCYTLSARRVKAHRTPLSGVRADQTELPWRCGTARNRVATAAKVECDYALHPRNELSSPLNWSGKSVMNIYFDLRILQTVWVTIRLTHDMSQLTHGSFDLCADRHKFLDSWFQWRSNQLITNSWSYHFFGVHVLDLTFDTWAHNFPILEFADLNWKSSKVFTVIVTLRFCFVRETLNFRYTQKFEIYATLSGYLQI